MPTRINVTLATALALWSCAVGTRYFYNRKYRSHFKIQKTIENTLSNLSYDPRGIDLLDKIARQRESDSFRDRAIAGKDKNLEWPGLRNAQISWTWLELLQGLHVESSYQGDYSWMFSKLNTIAQNSPKSEIQFMMALAPFYFVIGHDYIGANLLTRELVLRAPENWRVWFWSGFHAMENLKDRKLAGDYFRQSALFPDSPPYTAALSVRLSRGEEFIANSEKAKILTRDSPPELLEKIKKSRPDWFKK